MSHSNSSSDDEQHVPTARPVAARPMLINVHRPNQPSLSKSHSPSAPPPPLSPRSGGANKRDSDESDNDSNTAGSDQRAVKMPAPRSAMLAMMRKKSPALSNRSDSDSDSDSVPVKRKHERVDSQPSLPSEAAVGSDSGESVSSVGSSDSDGDGHGSSFNLMDYDLQRPPPELGALHHRRNRFASAAVPESLTIQPSRPLLGSASSLLSPTSVDDGSLYHPFSPHALSTTSSPALHRGGRNLVDPSHDHLPSLTPMQPPLQNGIASYGLPVFDRSVTAPPDSGANGPIPHSPTAESKLSSVSPMSSSRPGLMRKATIETSSVKMRAKQGLRTVNQYVIVRSIGRGVYGKVKLVYDQRNQQYFAMKIMDKNVMKKRRVFSRALGMKAEWDNIKREVAIMKKLNHPNIVTLCEVIDDTDNDKLFLVMELVERGAVMKGIPCQPFDEHLARAYFRDLIAGLEYLHYQRVIHRDIKPENLLLTRDGRVKISDFGVSSAFTGENDLFHDTEGSAAFMAPEMCTGTEHTFSGRLCDIWAAGVTLFSFAFGSLPFVADTVPATYALIQHQPVSFPAPISEELKDLLLRMLMKEPQSRLTIAQIKEHPWVTKNGVWKMAPLEEDKTEMARDTVTDKEVDNAWVLLVKLKTKIHRKRALQQARRMSAVDPVQVNNSTSGSPTEAPRSVFQRAPPL